MTTPAVPSGAVPQPPDGGPSSDTDGAEHRAGTRRPRSPEPEALPPLEDLGTTLPRILKVVGSVVAPTTVLTALLFYFGRLHVTQFFGYFGVNFTALDLTLQDYLIRSADGLFVPVAVAASTALVIVWTQRLLAGRLAPQVQASLVRVLPATGTVVGMALVGIAVIGVIDPDRFSRYPELPGLALVIGVPLLAYVSRLSRLRPTARSGGPDSHRVSKATGVVEWAAVFVLVSVGLFWTVGNYAAAVGVGRGHDMEAALATWPDAVLYSAQRLSLRAPGVREVACTDPDAAYGYRYDGLKLVLHSGQQYLFLPAAWSRRSGAAILIPRTEALRLEFTAPGAVDPPPRTC